MISIKILWYSKKIVEIVFSKLHTEKLINKIIIINKIVSLIII
jgi:hypothetical protein